jgi:hypothetical protein
MVAAQLLLDRLTQILYQVETVGHLPCLRRALPSPQGIETAAVSTDDFDRGVFCKPVCRRLSGTIVQHVDDFLAFEIHDDCSVCASLQPTPVIDADNAEWVVRESRMALEIAKDSIVTLRHAKPPHQSLSRSPPNGIPDQTRQLHHPARLSCVGFDRLIGLVSKSLPITQLIATSPSGHAEIELDNRALDGQILHAPRIAAVAMYGLVVAAWARGISRSLCLDDPFLVAECGVNNPDAGTGLPSWFDFHQHQDRGVRPDGQPGHFTSTEIATEPLHRQPIRFARANHA